MILLKRMRRLPKQCLLWLVLSLPLWGAARVDRIDLYDKAGDLLLFVTIDYDSGGKNTGRSVFAGDSTFLRSTGLQRDASGAVVKETSTDFDSNLVYSTTLSNQAGKTTFSVADLFGLDQLGGPMIYGETSTNNYDISQNGSPIYKVLYQFGDDGILKRINVLDKSQEIVFYAMVATSTGTTAPHARSSGVTTLRLRTLDRSGFHVAMELAAAGRVTLEIFSFAGKRICVPVDKKYAPGSHAFVVDGRRGALGAVGNGAYIYVLSINGVHCLRGKCILQR
jgi:hypothetical protein